jgi:uncharacterized coiled-coil protein SlyX
MFLMSTVIRACAVGAVAALGIVAAVAGQDRPSPAPAGSGMDALLVEVRALRADMNQAASASMRAQLVGMRLQLQEQRITSLARQLADTQERLRGQEDAMAPLAAQLKMFEGPDVDASEKQETEHLLGPIKAQLAQFDKAVQQLRQEENSVSQLLAEEQSRWTRFNALVEELEKAAAVKPVR